MRRKKRRRKLKEWDGNEGKKDGWESGEFGMFRKLGEKEGNKGRKECKGQLRDCCK